jgi:hypothetical protein
MSIQENHAMNASSKAKPLRTHYRLGTNPFRRPAVLVGFILLILAALLLANQVIRHAGGADLVLAAAPADPKAQLQGNVKKDPFAWEDLCDGKTLKGWTAPKFGGEGKVEVKDGAIVLHAGDTLTGITCTGKPPRTNYELTLDGRKLDGADFFATTTFPVGDKCVSLVTGGWGGSLVGISCVDFYDASDNATTKFHDFKKNQWYSFRIRVTDAKIECWIDKEKMVDLARKGHKFSVRMECDLSQPLGVSSYATSGAVKNIRVRNLKPEEVKAAADAAAKEAGNE